MLKNILYFSASIVLFFIGVILYGVILNLREDTLAEAMNEKGIKNLGKVFLVVDRHNYKMDLYSDTVLVKSYKAVFGSDNSTYKMSKEDLVTPLGKYFICGIDNKSRYHKYFKINYPSKRDAAEALKNGYISKEDFRKIMTAPDNECPPDDTPLGADIGIHGIGKYNFIFKNLPFVFNWTNGSIAVSNENIDELFSVAGIGTQVEIINR
ncbi:MAG: L,D-transpeptidase [bacterium]